MHYISTKSHSQSNPNFSGHDSIHLARRRQELPLDPIHKISSVSKLYLIYIPS